MNDDVVVTLAQLTPVVTVAPLDTSPSLTVDVPTTADKFTVAPLSPLFTLRRVS